MAFQPAPDVALVELIGTLDSQRVQNTLYFHRGGGWDAGALVQLSSLINNWYVNEMLPNQSNGYRYLGCEVTDLSTQNGPAVTNFIDPSLTGGIVAESEPNSVCICVSFRTPFRGRSARGRNYISGLATSEVTQNRLDLTRCASIVQAYNLLPALAVAVPATWCVLTRYANNAPRPVPFTFAIQQAIIVDNIVDSQRRRLPGRGQ